MQLQRYEQEIIELLDEMEVFLDKPSEPKHSLFLHLTQTRLDCDTHQEEENTTTPNSKKSTSAATKADWVKFAMIIMCLIVAVLTTIVAAYVY